jgi:hypothetical protein
LNQRPQGFGVNLALRIQIKLTVSAGNCGADRYQKQSAQKKGWLFKGHPVSVQALT